MANAMLAVRGFNMQKKTDHDGTPGLRIAALSDIGLRRTNNQDAYGVLTASDEQIWHQRGHLFLVADGMGAHAAGELASELAAEKIPHNYCKLVDHTPPEALRQAIVEANHEIHSRGQANIEFHGMGTTASTLLLLPQGAVVGHVGDSRVYRLRGHQLEQLTFDHSLVWEMIAEGQFAEEDVPNYVPRNVITRSLGPNSEVKVDLEGPFPLEVGDKFLLCSDGLTGQVQDRELGIILDCLPPDDAVRTLVDLANLRGGPDNITIVVAEVTGEKSIGSKHTGWQSAPGRNKNTPRVPLAVWVLLGVFSLLALVLVGIGQMIPAAVAAAAALVAAIVAMVRALESDEASTASVPLEGRLGQGPHRSRNCKPDKSFVQKLRQISEQLREAAEEEQWPIEWQQFNDLRDGAESAAKQGDFSSSVREYSHAISFMMAQLRKHGTKKAPNQIDSGTSSGDER